MTKESSDGVPVFIQDESKSPNKTVVDSAAEGQGAVDAEYELLRSISGGSRKKTVALIGRGTAEYALKEAGLEVCSFMLPMMVESMEHPPDYMVFDLPEFPAAESYVRIYCEKHPQVKVAMLGGQHFESESFIGSYATLEDLVNRLK